MKTNSLEKRRASVIALFFFLWVGVVLLQLFKIQVFEYATYSEKIRAQTMRVMNLHSKRGTIYDRGGEILAISVKTKSAFISSKDTESALRVFQGIAQVISLTQVERQKIVRRIRRGEKFVWVKRKLGDSDYQKLAALTFAEGERGILNFVEEFRRIYPQKRIACHILGGVGIDEQPLGGIELALDAEIRGKGGKIRTLMDARKKVFDFRYIDEPQSGRDIALTIDSGLQFIVERELRIAVEVHQARSGTVIVLDSREGSVLAMANYPDYSPEDISHATPNALRNRAISFLFDPGSTFKVVLAAAAIENRVCYPRQVFNCHNGVYRVQDRVITDVHPYGQLTFQDIIIHSSNIGAALIGERVGAQRMFDMIAAFGFGRRTGLCLPGEENGILNPIGRWTAVSLPFVSHGYEISVTPMQMARAFNTIAAGGTLMKLNLLKEGAGQIPAADRVRILSSGTVQQLVSMLDQVVERGTGTKARIDGLTIAGKTGTAQKVMDGKYASVHVSSFGGFFPAQDPQVTIFVVIDEPTGDYYGGDVAAPLFKNITQKLLAQLKIFPVIPGQRELAP